MRGFTILDGEAREASASRWHLSKDLKDMREVIMGLTAGRIAHTHIHSMYKVPVAGQPVC